MSSLKSKVILLASSTLVAFLMLEIALRIVIPPPTLGPSGVGTTDTPKAKIYGWAYPPNENTVFRNPDTGEMVLDTTNSQGWKDVEHSIEKPPGTVRILFVGDSVTWGVVPLEDLYTRQVEHLLHDAGYTQVEVISIGVGAWGTDQVLEAIQTEGLSYQPDIVVYQFTSNDVTDIISPDEDQANDIRWNKPFRYEVSYPSLDLTRIEVEPSPAAEEEDPGLTVQGVKEFLLKSAVIYYLNALTTEMTHVPHLPEWVVPLDPEDPTFQYPTGDLSPEMQDAWFLLEALVVKMQDITRASGADLIIFSEQDAVGHRDFALHWGLIETDAQGDFITWEGKRYDIDQQRPNEELAAIAARHDIPFILPTGTYERYTYDWHPNANGNYAMAQDIVDFLLDWEPFLKLVGEQ